MDHCLIYECCPCCLYLFHSYCPGGPDSDFEYSTQSYTGYEVSSAWLTECSNHYDNNAFIACTGPGPSEMGWAVPGLQNAVIIMIIMHLLPALDLDPVKWGGQSLAYRMQ